MTRKLSSNELKNLILRLCDAEALELIRGSGGKIYIPFIMNDAVEAYCTLTQTVVPSSIPEDASAATGADITEKDDRTGIIIRDGEAVLATVWYRDCIYEERFYQYHRILHCWAEGNEHMRMLVYMIGTMRDKFENLGEASCNEMERSLLPLMEYRPFRFFSPMGESIDSWYPETGAGYEAMEAFAKEAGDAHLLRLMRLGRLSGRLFDQKISERIASSGRVFELIYAKICKASEMYDRRSYPEFLEKRMQEKRDQAHLALIHAGYTGKYPFYKKNASYITVFEEHPFTISEMDDMEFSLQMLERTDHAGRVAYRVIVLNVAGS